jgi:hypothetical protein
LSFNANRYELLQTSKELQLFAIIFVQFAGKIGEGGHFTEIFYSPDGSTEGGKPSKGK